METTTRQFPGPAGASGTASDEPSRPPSPNFAVAAAVLDALTAYDLPGLAVAFDDDAVLSALLPRGFFQWTGPVEICDRFEQWFGGADRFEVLDASVGQVGGLLQLRWRLRVQAERLGDGPRIVEQQVNATTGPSGRIAALSLLCSGFWPEHPDS